MDESRLRFGVGVLVIAAIGIGVILTFLFGAFPAILSREYTLIVDFPSAQGINTNTPVLRDGVKIGRVSRIQLRNEGGVKLTLAMDETYPMLHRYIPQIGIGSLITGDSKLEFRKAEPQELQALFPDDMAMIDRTYSDGEYIKYGQKLDDPFTLLFGMEDELRNTFGSIRHAGDAVQGAGESVKSLVHDVRGLIGIESPRNARPAGYPPQTTVIPNGTWGHDGVASPMLTNAAVGGQMPPAPSWAHPVRLVSASTYTKGNTPEIRTVAFAQVDPNEVPGGASNGDPTGTFQPALTPPLGRPPVGGTTPTFVQLQTEAIETLEELQGAIRDARSILGNEEIRRGLRDSVERFPGVLDQANVTLRTAQKTFDSFAEVGEQFDQVGSVAEQAINELKITAGDTLQSFQATAKNVEAFTDPFGRRSEEFADQMLRSLVSVDDALIQIDAFGKTLNGSDGTIKRLIEDDEMYFAIKRTVENIEAATARARPILDDFRVFTDKIVRDPRQLGVRGALGHRPTGAGLK